MIELDAMAAERMSSLILEGSQSTEMLIRQQPLSTIDLGDAWLVRGRPYDDTDLELKSCMFYIVLGKKMANIVSISLNRQFLKSNHANDMMKISDIDAKTTNSDSSVDFDLACVFQGDLINSPSAAVEYARQIMRCFRSPNAKSGEDAPCPVPTLRLEAEERNRIWHITEAETSREVLAFSRVTCQLIMES